MLGHPLARDLFRGTVEEVLDVASSEPAISAWPDPVALEDAGVCPRPNGVAMYQQYFCSLCYVDKIAWIGLWLFCGYQWSLLSYFVWRIPFLRLAALSFGPPFRISCSRSSMAKLLDSSSDQNLGLPFLSMPLAPVRQL
jgi:hypothetical protein